MTYPTLTLNKDQERRLLAGHVWIYSNEINTSKSPLSTFKPGDLVRVETDRNKPLGIAYINPHTLLCARLLTRQINETIDQQFFSKRLKSALMQRELLFNQPYYRWVYGESDNLPGLILDRYKDVIVGQLNTAGMDRFRETLQTAIQECCDPKTIIWRNDSSYRQLENLPQSIEIAFGESIEEGVVEENNCHFYFPLQGQKTGWFYDHRTNRKKLIPFVHNKRVLDVFSYLGAFAIPLAKAGASEVTCIDSSKNALTYVEKNAVLNQVQHLIHTREGDAFTLLNQCKEQGEKYDVIILDPPAFIKRKKEFHQGLKAYEQLNTLALPLLNRHGILFTASCSMHLSAADLLNCLRRASISTKRPLAIIEQCHQDRDHPIHPAIEETNYLKGFIAVCQD